jgi:hypothetical protein
MAAATVPVHRLSVDDVYRMVEPGVLDETDRVELVEGVLVEMVLSRSRKKAGVDQVPSR